jgi:hypothetical protein
MRKRVSSIVLISAVCAALGVTVFAAGASAAVRHFDATVVSKSAANKTVKVRTSGSTMNFKVTSRTKFERIAGGFSGLTRGLAIEVDANNASGRWVATQIEADRDSGGGDDDHGGDDHGGHGGGHDDGPNHT